ncbi:hypothetical protein LCM19_07190 [Qipengyuania flava]|nr:hypothetical protein [Qipengyuania flava]
MFRRAKIAAAAIVLTTPGAIVVAQESEPKKEEKSEKITDSDHPDFVRCRTEKVIGSLAKRRKVCLANREWEEFARRGNDAARQTVAQNAAGMTTD